MKRLLFVFSLRRTFMYGILRAAALLAVDSSELSFSFKEMLLWELNQAFMNEVLNA